MSLHVGEQLSINVTQGQIHKSEKKEEKNEQNKETSMGPSGGYIGSVVVKWLELKAGDRKTTGLI